MKKLLFVLCAFIVFASCTFSSKKKKDEPVIQSPQEALPVESEKTNIALPQKIDTSILNKPPIVIKVDTGKGKDIKMMKKNIHSPTLDTIAIH
jgi:hypothetical protein